MPFPVNSEATWSFMLMIGCVVSSILIFLWMRFCYYPGGYKRDEVMDMGEYSMIMHATGRLKPKEFKYQEEDEEIDELYYEMTPRTENQDAKGADWQSMGTSEQDVEGGEYYDGAMTSPSTRSVSDAAPRRYVDHVGQGRGIGTPSSVAVSAAGYNDGGNPLKSAMKGGPSRFRDDRSESTAGGSASTPQSARSGRTHDTYHTHNTHQTYGDY